MAGKITSYYDWELGFKKKPKSREKVIKSDENMVLGIPKSKFRKFIDEWKKENL